MESCARRPRNSAIPRSARGAVDVSRRPATITQADIARAIRAAKQAGAAEVEVRMGDQTAIFIRLNLSTGDEKRLEPGEEIIL